MRLTRPLALFGAVVCIASTMMLVDPGAASALPTNNLLYSVDGGATWSANVTATPGQTILVREWYDNGDATSYVNESLTTTVPAGFTIVPNSTEVCTSPLTLTPTSPISTQDTCAASNQAAVFSGQTLTVSPTNGLYGQANNLTAGTLNIGQKQYLNLNQCTYEYVSGDNFTSVVNDLPASTYDAGTNAANSPQTTNNCGPVQPGYVMNASGSAVQAVDLLGQRYLNLNQCAYENPGSGDNFTSVVNDLPASTFDAGTNAANSPQTTTNCGPVQPGYVANASGSAVQAVDLLGQRYLNLNQCVYQNPGSGDNFTSVVNNLPAYTFDAGTNAASSPQTTNNCGPVQPGYVMNASGSGVQAIDLLDTTRGAGFAQFSIVAPSPSNTTTYSQSAALSGSAAANSSGSITVDGVVSAPVIDPKVGIGLGAAAFLLGGVALARSRRSRHLTH